MNPPALAPALLRRRLLGRALLLPLSPLVALAACASRWPDVPAGPGSPSARSRLQESADAHGLAAWRRLQSVSLGFAGFWSPLGAAAGAGAGAAAVQARWRPGDGVLAIGWPSAAGQQQLWRRIPGTEVQRWRDGRAITDPAERQAAALLADLHRLLWLGPMAVADTTAAVQWAEPQTLQGQRCDHLHLALAPGLGFAATDRLSLFIDRDQGLLRRLRVSLSSLGTSLPGLAEVDLFEHRRLHGVAWPTRFEARSPDAASWRLVGLEVDRGFSADDLGDAVWRGKAAEAAHRLPNT